MYNWIDICYGIGCRDIYPFSFSSTSHLLTMSSFTFYTFLCPSFIFPPFFTFTYVYLFVTFDLLLISPFYTSSMLFYSSLFSFLSSSLPSLSLRPPSYFISFIAFFSSFHHSYPSLPFILPFLPPSRIPVLLLTPLEYIYLLSTMVLRLNKLIKRIEKLSSSMIC